jgi:hypothetical protein
MNTEDLSIYLKDHLAGSVAAVELVDHLIDTYAGKPLELFFTRLRADITADQDQLRDLMRALEVKESRVRKAGAWIAEKIAHAKFDLNSENEGGLGLLQAFEMLVLGIEGKHVLWRTLAAVIENSPQLRPIDFAQLECRAHEQRERVEARRLDAARHAFISG